MIRTSRSEYLNTRKKYWSRTICAQNAEYFAERDCQALESVGYEWEPEKAEPLKRVEARNGACLAPPDRPLWASPEECTATYREAAHRYNVFGQMLEALRMASSCTAMGFWEEIVADKVRNALAAAKNRSIQ